MGSSQSVCLARQSIYNLDLAPCGYELLYRPAPTADSAADGSDDTVMSAVTLQAALLDFGLDALVGRRPVWVNAGHALLIDDLVAALPPERTVVEVLERATPDGRLLDAVAKLRDDGYRIALDDFVFSPERAPLLELADVVKIDVLGVDRARLEQQVDALSGHDVVLLAEKVETHDVLDDCRELGFSLFQGYFLSKPRMLSSEPVSSETVLRIQLLAQLNDPDAGFDRIADVIAADVTLGYRMLRYVNSAYVGLRRPVGSLQQALVELGSRRVRSWATLLLITEAAAGRRDLAATALLRASMCSALAEATGDDPESAFTVGLLSVVDALLDCTLSDAVADLPIRPDIADALVRRDGSLGTLLDRVAAYERGDFAAATGPPLDPPSLIRAYVDAIEWSGQMLSQAPA